ncbi:MAG: DUF211 domain-containing protein [Candidatus Bipolaricaulota bacterium]
MAKIRRIVLDIMKPLEPSVITYSSELADLDCIEGVNLSMVEIDHEVENIKATLEGSNIEYERVEDVINRLGGSVHSVDKVLCGKAIVKELTTPQD